MNVKSLICIILLQSREDSLIEFFNVWWFNANRLIWNFALSPVFSVYTHGWWRCIRCERCGSEDHEEVPESLSAERLGVTCDDPPCICVTYCFRGCIVAKGSLYGARFAPLSPSSHRPLSHSPFSICMFVVARVGVIVLRCISRQLRRLLQCSRPQAQTLLFFAIC